MADTTALKNRIRAAIKANDNQEITGPVLQQALLDIVDELNGATETEATARGNADTQLQTNINNEATARGNADTQLQTNINNEATARGNADTQLNNLITGIKNNIENGYVYAGIATPSSTPTTGNVFYLALTAGTYTNFGATVVPQGINILKYNGSTWSLDSFLGLDDAPTQSSNNLVKSGSVLDSIIKDGSAFDLSAYNNGATYTDLSAALTALNALPAAYKKGGMSMKFVQSSDNKYMQFRCIADEFTNDVKYWQSENVDKEPKENSDSLITSGAVEKKIGSVISKVGPFSITDENGFIGVVADNDGLKAKDFYIIINGELIPISNIAKYIKTSSGFYVCDESGYILFGIRNDGSVIGKSFDNSKYIKTSSGFYVCDESGYILFGVRNNGTVIGKLSDDFCKAIELRGTTYNVVNNKITIPNSAIQIEYAAKLSLPKKINMLQGHVYNLYYEQMLGYGFIRDYKVSETSLPYHPLYYSFLHNSTTVGNTTKTIRLWNGFGYKLEEKSLIINTVNKETAGNLKICVIGDSMTENPKKLFELANLAANDSNFSITFLGAVTATGTDSDGNTRTVKHCGYSGRNIIDVCQLASYGENRPNIFYDSTLETTNKFSIAKGIATMGDTPDVIIIDHGANQAVNSWADVKGCYDFIINDIAAYNTAHNTDIKVVICVQQPGGLIDTINVPLLGSKWGRDYAPTKLMNYVNEYDDREDEGIFLLPQYLIIDPYKDYPRTDAPYSGRNTSLREIALDNVHMGINMNNHSANHVYSYGEICTDGNDNGYISLKNNNTEPLSDDKVHWAKTKDDVNAGYWKLADIYFAELKYIAGL